MLNSSMRDNQQMHDISKAGPCVKETISGAETELDCSALATSGYPLSVEIEARDAGVYIRQGATGVKLNTTADQNLRMLPDSSRVFTIDSASDAFFTFESIDHRGGTIVACKISEV